MPLASQRGKKKTNALQPAKGMTDENIAFGEPEGKKKANALQPAKGMTDENIAFGEPEGEEENQRFAAGQRHDRRKKKNARAADARAFHRGIALV